METTDRDCVRVMAIDPGSRSLGISIVDCFLHEQELVLTEAWTLTTEQALRRQRFRAARIGEHAVRLEAIYTEVLHGLQTYYPDAVVMETPYLGRLPQSFFVLTQVMTCIERAVADYSSAMYLQKIDPATVKKAIGVPGNSSDKELVRQAVYALPNLENLSGRSLESLSEHAIDGTAVAHYYCVSELGLKWVKPT
jgi:crossover junction endodeoxyribonuclease RuvC